MYKSSSIMLFIVTFICLLALNSQFLFLIKTLISKSDNSELFIGSTYRFLTSSKNPIVGFSIS